MNRRVFSVCAVLALAGAALFFFFRQSGSAENLRLEAARPPVEHSGGAPVLGLEEAFIRVAAAVSPAVVNIRSQWTERIPAQSFGDLEQFFHYWFYGVPTPPREFERRQQSLGSGFLITRDGFVITNAHVVGKAREVRVRLKDGRDFKARVVGADEATDIAVVKIEAKEEFPAVVLGDSDAVRVGQWTVAVGNPFGLDHTVTTGVLSAKGRAVPLNADSPYRSYLQTDASINPGNSGGPLCNIRGEVIGINTAIFSQTGGSVGIGFAIPSNVARKVARDLVERGEVVRAGLGVTVQELDADLARSFGLEAPRGALIADVQPDGAAKAAGLKRGDVVTALDGVEVEGTSDLVARLYTYAPGDEVELTVLRDRRKLNVKLRLRPIEGKATEKKQSGPRNDSEREASPQELGFRFEDPGPEIQHRLPEGAPQGPVVISVAPRSPAQLAGLRPGDIILEAGEKEIGTAADLERVLKKADLEKGVRLLLWRDGVTLYTYLKTD